MLGLVTNSISTAAGRGIDGAWADMRSKPDSAARSFSSILQEREAEGRSRNAGSAPLDCRGQLLSGGSKARDDDVEDENGETISAASQDEPSCRCVDPLDRESSDVGEDNELSGSSGATDVGLTSSQKNNLRFSVSSGAELPTGIAAGPNGSAAIVVGDHNGADAVGRMVASDGGLHAYDKMTSSEEAADCDAAGLSIGQTARPGKESGKEPSVAARTLSPHVISEAVLGTARDRAEGGTQEAFRTVASCDGVWAEPARAPLGGQSDTSATPRGAETIGSQLGLHGELTRRAEQESPVADPSPPGKTPQSNSDMGRAHDVSDPGGGAASPSFLSGQVVDMNARIQSNLSAIPAASLPAGAQSAAERRLASMVGSLCVLRDTAGHERLPSAISQDIGTSGELRPFSNVELRVGGVTQDAAPQVARQVAAQIAEVIGRGAERAIDVLLNPSELGRVRITLSQGETGMIVNVAAERAETLDLMRRHEDLLGQEFDGAGHEGTEFSFAQDDRANEGRAPSEPSETITIEQPAMPITVAQVAGQVAIMAADRIDVRF
ncbi:flagellar hook-length control protein FliK [Roseovarius sp. S4756]|uniref:flagellar hook-length control protein FliK n=1 Tax=Roseovarius maritimus TaxID=3342637 RepID=UPI0037263546